MTPFQRFQSTYFSRMLPSLTPSKWEVIFIVWNFSVSSIVLEKNLVLNFHTNWLNLSALLFHSTIVASNAFPLDISGSCCPLWLQIWLHFFWLIFCQRAEEMSWSLLDTGLNTALGTWCTSCNCVQLLNSRDDREGQGRSKLDYSKLGSSTWISILI